MTKVGVILDWTRAARGNAWELLLKEVIPKPDANFYPIADLIVAPVEQGQGLQQINTEQVLIINWDAANGDPEFGGHLCQRWLEHRRPEIIEWVRKGGILLIESQTTLGVPCAAAYDAVVGNGELPTSGLEDPTKPLQSATPRSGAVARKTSRFPTGHGFGSVEDRIVARTPYPDLQLFPKTTTGLLADALRNADSGPLLWRGVFRKTLPFTRQFPWISVIETESGALYRQSVMQVAKIGDGAIFASTMMLAITRQYELVSAILRCANGNTLHLPNPVAAVDRVKTGVKWFLTIFGGIVAAFIVSETGTVQSGLSDLGVPTGALEGWVQLLLFAAGIGIVVLGQRLLLRLRKFIRRILGY